MKRVGLYLRVSSADQNHAAQRCDLLQLVQQRGWQVVEEYVDTISGVRARRPGLDRLLNDARRGRIDVVAVWAFDRLARSVRHFLQVIDELAHLHVEFVSFRENIDTTGPTGRIVLIILSAVAELERNLIIERVRSGMRRAKLEGQHIGRPKLIVDRDAVIRDRQHGFSIRQIAKLHRLSRTSVCRVLEMNTNIGGAA
jgi:DNA invertase Pin-like site-specific DNA recombinase